MTSLKAKVLQVPVHLDFPGVKIEAVKVVGMSKASTPNTLVTYFDESHIDLGNCVEGTDKVDVDIKAVVSRLNHEPFKYVITVNSNKKVTGVVRMFLAPKYDWFGQEIPFKDARWSVIELDRFPVKLNAGDNVVTRNSEDSIVTIPEPRSFPELLHEVQQALKGDEEYIVDKVQYIIVTVSGGRWVVAKHYRHCGIPHRLLLPKGRTEGMAYKLLIVITDYSKDATRQGYTRLPEMAHGWFPRDRLDRAVLEYQRWPVAGFLETDSTGIFKRDILAISSIVYCESSVLEHTAIKAGADQMKSDYGFENATRIHPNIQPEDVEDYSSLGYCGVMEGKIPDSKPMGYPFDRPIRSMDNFFTPNFKVIDLTIKNIN
uniref:Hemocyanin C-terminal domain-containing protein n=1 Tax=Timema monikensis TaxID=170555 RepID=A0A7R9E590_9NEOP|nr:unnamed protein product [Timema monikensis]